MTAFDAVRIALGTAVLAAAGVAGAQGFPSKQITIVLPFPAGSPIDIEGRPMAQFLERIWGQPVVIEPRAGAGGLVAMRYIAAAPADGHTLAMGTATLSMYKVLFKDAGIEPLEDLTPLSLIIDFPGGFIVNTKIPVRTIEEFVAYAKANPGKVNYGSLGPNSTMLIMEAFKRAAGIQMTEVPFQGPPQMYTALVRNDVQIINQQLNLATLGQVKAGDARALLMTGSKRARLFPDVPTSVEKGWNLPLNTWIIMVAPKDTPSALAARISADLKRWAESPETQKRAEQTGLDYPTSTPAETRRLIENDSRMWATVAKEVGLKPQ
jgi:tripartite-type tricarboxylate transporter receptor subunit TctC